MLWIYYNGYILSPGTVNSNLGNINPYIKFSDYSSLIPVNNIDYSNLSVFSFSPNYSQMSSSSLKYRSLTLVFNTGNYTLSYFRLKFSDSNLYDKAEGDSSEYGYKASKPSAGTYNFGTNMLLYGKGNTVSGSNTNWIDLGQGTSSSNNMTLAPTESNGMAYDNSASFSDGHYYRTFKMLNVKGKLYIVILLRENSEIYFSNVHCYAYQSYSNMYNDINSTLI